MKSYNYNYLKVISVSFIICFLLSLQGCVSKGNILIKKSGKTINEYKMSMESAYFFEDETRTKMLITMSKPSNPFITDTFSCISLYICTNKSLLSNSSILDAKTFFIKSQFKETLCGEMNITDPKITSESDGNIKLSADFTSENAYIVFPEDDTFESSDQSVTLSFQNLSLIRLNSYQEFEKHIDGFDMARLKKFFSKEWGIF